MKCAEKDFFAQAHYVAFWLTQGNTSGRDIASDKTTRRGQRPWHVQTLLARKLGDLAIYRSATAVGPHREREEP
jgi:hypothetical protein